MAPRKAVSNEVTRFLRASRELIVENWTAGLLSKAELRRKLPKRVSGQECTEVIASIYDSLIIPLSHPTSKGRTRKVRLKAFHKKFLASFSLHDIQEAELVLLDVLNAAAAERYSGRPKKIEKFTTMFSQRVHDLLLQTSRGDFRRREKTAALAESTYARLLNIANDAIFLLNLDSGLFLEANKAACELTGYSGAELKQMGFNSLVSVFDLNLALEKANAAVETGSVRFDDLSIYTKKGTAVPVDISASVVTIDDTKYILAIMRDIKERKSFEEKIRQKTRELQLINEVAHAISSADLDIEAVLTSILKSVARLVRVEAGSVLCLEDEELVFMAALGEKAECVKPFRLKLGQGIAGWVAKTGESLTVRDVHSDPRYYPEIERLTGFVTRSILAVPMRTGDAIVGVIELINKIGARFTKRDLSLMNAVASFAAIALEHARLFSECELARMRLSEMHLPMDSSRLAAVVVHEMKDPLGIVKNYVRILADKLALTGMKHEELAVISDELERIASITDQLLHFSEAYSENRKETPLNLLIENSIESMREKLDAASIDTKMRLAGSVPHVFVIPNQMQMVFSNLIRLAISEMPEGGILTVSTRKHDSAVCIEFSSTGPKLTSEEANELFLPSAVAKGLVPKGLGLYMVDNIIRSYGGEIEVKARRGEGNTFRIMIPINSNKPPDGASK